MEAKLQRWVQRHGWDRAVEHYEAYWREQLRPVHEASLAVADPRPGELVVDIACGTGMVTLPAAQAVGPRGHVTATDISQKMIDDTAQRARDLGLANVDVERRGAEELGELKAAGGFDVALCSLGLMYVPHPAVAIGEIARVLRPGGRAVVAVWGERRNCGWAGIFPIVDARVQSDVCPMFFALGAPGNLARLVLDAGFVDVGEQRIRCELVYDNAESALGAAFAGGPVALAYSRFDDDTRAAAHAEYLRSIEPYRVNEGYRIPGEFVIVAGTTPAGSAAGARPTESELHQTTNNHHRHLKEQP